MQSAEGKVPFWCSYVNKKIDGSILELCYFVTLALYAIAGLTEAEFLQKENSPF